MLTDVASTHATNLRMHHASLAMRKGTVVGNAASGRTYRIDSLLGVGGFGAVYRVTQVGGSRWDAPVCLKVTVDPLFWHSEAYFGHLLRDVPGVIRVFETFAWLPRGKDALPLYCLVSEFAESGDLAQVLKTTATPWKERTARRQIIQLARTVKLLHAAGAVHRDITPANVFVARDGQLKLGDFGIASHRVGNRGVRADAFNPAFAQTVHVDGRARSWKPSDDVFHLGQLFAVLLCGKADKKLTTRDVKSLVCSAAVKSVIQRCIGPRARRIADADAMLALLERQETKDGRAPSIRTLRGHRVVFTGGLSIRREEAARLLKKAGGILQKRVGPDTDVVVVGDQSPAWVAGSKGRKLLDVDREKEAGHEVATVTERRFRALTSA